MNYFLSRDTLSKKVKHNKTFRITIKLGFYKIFGKDDMKRLLFNVLKVWHKTINFGKNKFFIVYSIILYIFFLNGEMLNRDILTVHRFNNNSNYLMVLIIRCFFHCYNLHFKTRYRYLIYLIITIIHQHFIMCNKDESRTIRTTIIRS